jgi:hypothetical protein
MWSIGVRSFALAAAISTVAILIGLAAYGNDQVGVVSSHFPLVLSLRREKDRFGKTFKITQQLHLGIRCGLLVANMMVGWVQNQTIEDLQPVGPTTEQLPTGKFYLMKMLRCS